MHSWLFSRAQPARPGECSPLVQPGLARCRLSRVNGGLSSSWLAAHCRVLNEDPTDSGYLASVCLAVSWRWWQSAAEWPTAAAARVFWARCCR